MSFHLLRRITYALGIIAILGATSGRLLQYGAGPAVFGSVTGMAASIALTSPLVIGLAFLLLSGVPGGRKIVPIPGTRAQDSMLFILALTGLTPDLQIRALVPDGWAGGSYVEIFVVLITQVVCVCVRVIHLSLGERLGVTLEYRTTPTLH